MGWLINVFFPTDEIHDKAVANVELLKKKESLDKVVQYVGLRESKGCVESDTSSIHHIDGNP